VSASAAQGGHSKYDRTIRVTPVLEFNNRGLTTENRYKLEMWANAQRDGRPAEYRWRPLSNAAKFGCRPLLECRAVVLSRRETR